MPTILATVAIWLVISAHGIERQQVGPFATLEECGLHRILTLMRIKSFSANGMATMIDGRVWPAEAIEVECLPGERPA